MCFPKTNIILVFSALNGAFVLPSQLKLVQDLLESYDRKAKPTWDNNRPINVTFSMDLYQILELNEPQQYILLNAWIIERWHDEFLYWNPDDYNNITEIRLPHDSIWLPDTTLYNSLVMKDDDTRRLLNAKLTTNATRRAALIELLYPTIYKFSCLLNLQFFPFDIQVCTMTFSSWTYDNKGIDYLSFSDTIGTSNYLENEGWYILKTTVKRKEVKYSCCPNKYTLLKLTLYLRRKPLFYLVNLIIPTSIITLIAIVGFFTTSSASGMREEKVSLGITTLLSMSILMLMVSDQMPTTSTFIPLIGWFILGMIVVISIGTLASSVVIAVQKRGRLGERLTERAVRFAKVFSYISLTDVPPHLKKGTKENMEAPPATDAYRKSGRISSKLSSVNRGMVFADAKMSWVSALKKAKTQPQNFNGVTMVSDKSTDMLMSASTISDDLSSQAAMAPVSAIGGKIAVVPTGLPPIPPPPPAAVMQLTPCEDDTSQAESDNPDSSRPPTARPGRASKTNMVSHLNMFTGNVKQSRHLAQQEYEWLATVVERCCFIIFVFAFLLITCGINVIGFLHWLAVEEAIFERDD
ncbi:hypothetical protein QR680_000815 [Steinernema hermaphroditum]|uniref:Uncharacterized protein n=1 Tax=Steinernema hermaphroditum TaxID=289476 RepID=A0AA39LER3_9BILA|nr:hypothetical protein QR680_000815 [Steinernema hermaphroditum]